MPALTYFLPMNLKHFIAKTDVASLLTPAADSLAPARSALTGLRLRRIPIAAFPSSNSLLVERRGRRVGMLGRISDVSVGTCRSGSRVQCANSFWGILSPGAKNVPHVFRWTPPRWWKTVARHGITHPFVSISKPPVFQPIIWILLPIGEFRVDLRDWHWLEMLRPALHLLLLFWCQLHQGVRQVDVRAF